MLLLAQAKASGDFDGADGKTPEYGVDYGTQEQIADIAQSAAEILQPEVNQIKDDIANVQLAVSEKMDSYTIKTVMDSVATHRKNRAMIARFSSAASLL